MSNGIVIHVDTINVYLNGINETIGTCDTYENLPIEEEGNTQPEPEKVPAFSPGYCPTNLRYGERVVIWCGGGLAHNQSELGTFITYNGPKKVAVVAHADNKEYPDTYYSWRRVDD